MHAPDGSFGFQVLEIAPYRFARYAELRRKLHHADPLVAVEPLENDFLAQFT